MSTDTETRPPEAANDPALTAVLEKLDEEIRDACVARLTARATPFPGTPKVLYISTPLGDSA